MPRARKRVLDVDEVLRVVQALPGTEQHWHDGHVALRVRGKGFGYLSDEEQTLLVKATRDEQRALAATDPTVYEPSFEAGRFGWVRVRLAAADRGEVTELVTEAWRLTAPKRLRAEHEQAG